MLTATLPRRRYKKRSKSKKAKFLDPTKIRIGYQGDRYSFADEAAHHFAEAQELTNVEYVPLTSAVPVIQALQLGTITYGILAKSNTISGNISEANSAMQGAGLSIYTTFEEPCTPCLFKKDDTIATTAINQISSHIELLKQTENNQKKHCPNAVPFAVSDSSRAAKMLANGTLPKDGGVICSMTAGKRYKLTLVAEDISDEPNITTYVAAYCTEEMRENLKQQGIIDTD